MWQPWADGWSVVFEDVAEAFLIIRNGNASIQSDGNLQTPITFPMHTHRKVMLGPLSGVEVEDWWTVSMWLPNLMLAFLRKDSEIMQI